MKNATLRLACAWIALFCFAIVANAQDKTDTAKTAQKVTVYGTLTKEGVECQAMRQDKTKKLYTLTPRPSKSFKNGDHVKVTGTIAEVSICQQGTTISVSKITKIKKTKK
jgi:hypothetical protein